MIVSWNWLKDYVRLDVSSGEFEQRLMMAGLNHECTEKVGDDLAIDLEVTSNRPDCLGHIGVAREAAVLFGGTLSIPAPQPKAGKTKVTSLASVAIECPQLCNRYTARIIQGAKVGPSPPWLADRLTTLGIAVINNVVDITNYVLMECGQPLHAFDFAKLRGGKIIVRAGRPGEPFEAIDHRTYELDANTCVIADAERAVALGGVMGGAETEVSDTTTDLLIESAEFAPLSIRTTARRLSLHSPSSYRFERTVDPDGIDWASRRCCELILDLAGGELADGVIDVGQSDAQRDPVVLRFSQLKRLLGIDIEPAEVRRIFAALGLKERAADAQRVEVIPPSWRRDLTREADLIEEAARIHGYDQIPEDTAVPMTASARGQEDRLLEKLRATLMAAGVDEAMTISAVDESQSTSFSPWTDAAPLRASTPVLRRANLLRRSLVPSLLEARRTNEALGNERIELFEIAKVYWPRKDSLPQEERMIGITSGGDYRSIKGLVEGLVAAASPDALLEVRDATLPALAAGRSAELWLGGERFGFLGELSEAGLKTFGLRGATSIAEVRLAGLLTAFCPIRKQTPLSPFPAMTRDLNLVCSEDVRWDAVERIVRESTGELLESVQYQDTYRDAQRLGQGKKSLLFRVVLRSGERTLTGEEADQARDTAVAELAKQLGCALRA
ncbi:MAG: phenylalanine--tRNA ligase subunit beta [Planctomycetales bacterium]|nr:phenylalanine--tRNA ligase subunit beta [Planctomycetales bacterium]